MLVCMVPCLAQSLEALKVLGTTDPTHPAVDYLMNTAGPVNLGGTIRGVRLPQHFDFNEFRLTPAQVREKMTDIGWSKFVGFQTRNPMHRAHIELTRLAANEVRCWLLKSVLVFVWHVVHFLVVCICYCAGVCVVVLLCCCGGSAF